MQASAKPNTTRARRRAAKPPKKPVTEDDVRQWHAEAKPKNAKIWRDLDLAMVRTFVRACAYERSDIETRPLTGPILAEFRKDNRTIRNACTGLARALPLLMAVGVMDAKARNATTTLVRVISARLSEMKRGESPGLIALLRDLVWLKEILPPARPTRGRDHPAIRPEDLPRLRGLQARIAGLEQAMPPDPKLGQPQPYVAFACKVAITHMQFLERLGISAPLWPTDSNPSVRFAVSAVAAVYGDVFDDAAESIADAVSKELGYERALVKVNYANQAEAAAVRALYRRRRPPWMPSRARNS
jgi:hypothetical protein